MGLKGPFRLLGLACLLDAFQGPLHSVGTAAQSILGRLARFTKRKDCLSYLLDCIRKAGMGRISFYEQAENGAMVSNLKTGHVRELFFDGARYLLGPACERGISSILPWEERKWIFYANM